MVKTTTDDASHLQGGIVASVDKALRLTRDHVADSLREIYVRGVGWEPGDERLTPAAHQAAGIVAELAHCDIREAYERLFARAAARDRSPNDEALAVIAETVGLD